LRGCSACNPLRSEDVRGIPEGVPNQSRRTVKANGKTTAMSAEYNVADSAASPAAKNDTMSGFCNPTCTLYVKLQIIGTVQGLAQPLIHLKRKNFVHQRIKGKLRYVKNYWNRLRDYQLLRSRDGRQRAGSDHEQDRK